MYYNALLKRNGEKQAALYALFRIVGFSLPYVFLLVPLSILWGHEIPLSRGMIIGYIVVATLIAYFYYFSKKRYLSIGNNHARYNRRIFKILSILYFVFDFVALICIAQLFFYLSNN